MSTSGKAIALFSDGTGNTMIKGRGTNVFKTYEAIGLGGRGGGRQQIAFYDDGVGSEDNKLLKLLGGAFGWGLKRNVLELYTNLCRVYSPGDDIYLFGFSRGAYTVRTLAGLIVECGILRDAGRLSGAELNRLARRAYGAFRKHFRTWQGKAIGAADAGEKATAAFREAHSIQVSEREDGRVPIRFVGVWDTVDAVGVPIDHVADFWNRFVYPFRFSGFKLADAVAKGCHALAIDDERHTFRPVLWNETEEDNGRIEQVWFAGVHSNVGGGYPKQGLSLIALDWMMARAEEQELRFNVNERDRYCELQNPHDKLYDSRAGWAVYYRYLPRDIAQICQERGVGPKIHASVFERIAVGAQDYAPGNLPDTFEVVHTDRQTASLSPGAARAAAAGSPRARGGQRAPRLLAQVRARVVLRRSLHYMFLGCTLVAAGFVWLSRATFDGAISPLVPAWLDRTIRQLAGYVPAVGDWLYAAVLHPFLVFPASGLTVLAATAFAYFVGNAVRASCERIFEAYWRQAVSGPSTTSSSSAPSEDRGAKAA